MIYRIQHFQDNIYKVFALIDEKYTELFQGTLPEVEAYISLKEKGYNF